MIWTTQTINCRGKIVDMSHPVVMAIINVSPDSFYDGGQYTDDDLFLSRFEEVIEQGASIIDIGAMSSRPGAQIINIEEEKRRLCNKIELALKRFPEAIISVDTIHAETAAKTLEAGASIINDISGFSIDSQLLYVVAEKKAPYILMHMKGRPQDMQFKAEYEDVVQEILDFLIQKIQILQEHQIYDIIVDPGFGFGKTITHNFQILKKLEVFKILECPLLVGLSRKSFIYKTLNCSADRALNGSTALHMQALLKGARILRVHDVREAKECIQLYQALIDTP